ncbi:hypothetical protein D0Z08_06185 [Nocardioides immobilis]|uniref:Sulfotransferase family protein n=1 Tax=Nocardioides immobilis TaxID=2049295 RepID=A0A417Y5B8_9ACTN|nr:hypothetical protein [Nocardioides immobilis]RHW27878.1 hypothetical protein D0Z08_06185 [Nocardioides immobilis]
MVGDTVDVVLHIGCEKTGTTSIQQFLRRNRAALKDRGILYPRAPGDFRHVELGLYAMPDEALPEARIWKRDGYSAAPDVFRRRLRRRLRREITGAGASTVVLSDEALYRSDPPSIGRLRGLVDELAGQVRIVVYLRRQDDHLISRYQQAVKMGEVLDLDAWSRRDFAGIYDYWGRVTRWKDAFDSAVVAVRPFERARFPEGSLTRDFLEAAGLDVRADDLRSITARNESLGVEGVELLRLLNLHRVEHMGATPRRIPNRPHVKRLRQVDSGPQVTLPPAQLDQFMGQWEDSNRRVARELLGDPTGELFHTERKTDGTTTRQVLDPARLDDYLDLLEIPEHEHPSIRRIAEREASRSSAHEG